MSLQAFNELKNKHDGVVEEVKSVCILLNCWSEDKIALYVLFMYSFTLGPAC